VARFGKLLTAICLASIPAATARADAMLRDFAYPHPVAQFEFISQGHNVSMAYMDIAPTGTPLGKTIVLLHGKNFCGATWESVITPLQTAGYRVVVPDQIGFCKSSKPETYQYGLHQLAANTHALLAKLGVERPIVIGHSMGGMLAMRYALMFGAQTAGLVIVNPIGLEDWKAKGVPFATIDALYEREQKSSADTIRKYEQATYYAGQWKPEFERWVAMLSDMYTGSDGRRFAWSQALTSDMVFGQPVVHELENIQVPTLLLIGEKDVTAIGKDRATPAVAATLGHYPELARAAAARIKGANLVLFPDLGHAPHIQAPDQFNRALLDGLGLLAK
jgi:pimeloyl-ACP methyl ester carboxylesterase